MATVLIVDDHPNMRDALCRLFQGRGHVALSAASGEEAVEVGRRLRPDAAIVDLVLPTLDGFDAFGALKTQRPDLLGIAISGVLPEHEVQERCEGAGFAVFLSKHSDLSKLVEIVERALGLAPADSGPPASAPEVGYSIGMIGRCPAMVDVYRHIARIAPTPLTVLIEGDSTVGEDTCNDGGGFQGGGASMDGNGYFVDYVWWCYPQNHACCSNGPCHLAVDQEWRVWGYLLADRTVHFTCNGYTLDWR